jgi:dihydrodipicolinate synthase/N-acetylneuraminate lyase
MKTDLPSTENLARSVIAVPPLAWTADGLPALAPNRALAEHILQGGVSTILYGGNANLFHVGVDRFAETLAALEAVAPEGAWVIPSIGPDYGKMVEQAKRLAHSRFPTAMVLPMAAPLDPDGVEIGLREAAQAAGKPLVVYIKAEGYLSPDHAARLVDDGVVCSIKYAIARDNPTEDAYLDRLVSLVDRRRIASGMGERPAVAHLRSFGIASFTSGLVCIAPRSSQSILRACQAGRFDEAERLRREFLPLEDIRDRLSQIRVLHDAVTVSGIADMGRILPLLSNLSAEQRASLQAPVAALLDLERSLPVAA